MDRIAFLIPNPKYLIRVCQILALYCSGVRVLLTFHFQNDHMAHFFMMDFTIITDVQLIVRNLFDIGSLLEQNISGIY